MSLTFSDSRQLAPQIESRFITSLITAFVRGSNPAEILDSLSVLGINFDLTAALLKHHGILPVLYAVLGHSPTLPSLIPAGLFHVARESYHCSSASALCIQNQLQSLVTHTSALGIRMVPIKGAAFLPVLYQERPVRIMSDIDLLVRKDDLDRAHDALLALGYTKDLEGLTEKYWREHQYHLIFKPPQAGLWRVELHWGLDYAHEEKQILPELWNRTVEQEANGFHLSLLSPEDSLCCLALHWRHMGYNLLLKNVLDAALLLQKYPSFDWEYVLVEARRARFQGTLYLLLSQIKQFAGFALPPQIQKGLSVPLPRRILIDHFVRQNTWRLCKNESVPWLFLMSQILTCDSFTNLFRSLQSTPEEQFAKFFGLVQYSRQAQRAYRYRWLFMAKRLTRKIIKGY